jgi:hypothetical protein
MMSFSTPDVQDCPASNTRGAKFRRRQTFSRLPDEISEAIFLEDILDDTDLCALALVSHRFSRLIQTSLYSKVNFLVPKKKYLCFKRTLKKRQELARYVWEVRLTYKIHDSEDDAEFDALCQEMQQFLKMLPALRVLELLAGCKCSRKFTALFENPMSHLRALSFWNDGRLSSIQEVVKAISLPQIKRLWVGFDLDPTSRDGSDERIDQNPATFKCWEDALTGTSSLKELTLDGCSDSFAFESNLLKIPRKLEKLECYFRDTGHFSPKRSVEALGPLYSTLVKLDLNYYGPRHVTEPVADFSRFTCLEILNVDDNLCLEKWSSDRPDERCGFYNRLPFTLSMLRVSVPYVYCCLGYD